MTLMKKIAYLDCSSGIAGNMVLGALIDLGFNPERLNQLARSFGLKKIKTEIERNSRNGISGVLVRIIPGSPQKPRGLREILRIITSAKIPKSVKDKSVQAFKLLASAESRIHSVPEEKLHFHELGAVDTIIDIVGSILGFYELGVSEIYSSPITLGTGKIICEHGILPVPAPATLELLKGIPIKGGTDDDGELTTPTGAVLARVLAKHFGQMPVMRVEKIGYGLGERILEKRPNVMRIALGFKLSGTEELMQLETTIDDMNPEFYEPLIKAIFRAGALEVSIIPAQMKKSRPGVILKTLCSPENLESLTKEILTNSTTTGLKFYPVQRITLPRKIFSLKTKYGDVRVKKIELPSGDERIHLEYEDLKKISEKHKIPLITLEQEVIKKWRKSKTRFQHQK